MKTGLTPYFFAALLVVAGPLQAQSPPPRAAAVDAGPSEALPTLDASIILQLDYFQGPNFRVRKPVLPRAGVNQFIVDSDFGTFQADGNMMLMRRVAEINAIAALHAMSESDEFKSALKQAAQTPVNVARDLVDDPVDTLAAVPKGILGFLKRTGSSVKEATKRRPKNEAEGNVFENVSGYSKVKRELAIQLGVDPYSSNKFFQDELAKVARPAFAGKFAANLALSVVKVVSVANTAGKLNDALREKSPSELREMNFKLLTDQMGIANKVADAFLNNPRISPTSQTIIVDALGQLGNIPGQGEFIRNAAGSEDEHDGFAFQQCVELMALLTKTAPVTRIANLRGMTVCQVQDGTLVLPIQWDYAAWTPLAGKFIAELQAQKVVQPVTGYAIMTTGDVSPMAKKELAARGINLTTKALPGPLN
jgi:hypothetical protein